MLQAIQRAICVGESQNVFSVADARIENYSSLGGGIEDIHLDQCGFGARWRKATTLRCFRVVAPERLERRCRRPRGDLNCAFSMRPHIVLAGRDSWGIHWTARAAAYPKLLASCLADVFEDSAFRDCLASSQGRQPLRAHGLVEKQSQRARR